MKLAICAIFRNEARYLREWLEFHRLVGIERFYLYNNRSSDDYMPVLRPYLASGVVVLNEWPFQPPCQVEAYQHYIDAHLDVSGWTAFIDIDEFLWSPRYPAVTEALDTFPQEWRAIGVNWVCFGSGGEQQWEDIPVIERFTWRASAGISSNHYVKPVVRMGQYFTIHDPHFADVPTFTPSGRQNPGPHSVPHEHTILRINHYGTKSRQEWVERQRLGKPCAASAPSPRQCYDEVQGCEVEDCAIQRYLSALQAKLATP